MAYRSIDASAWPQEDDGPLSSAFCVRVAQNANQTSAQRAPSTSVVFPPAEPYRFCNRFQGCVGPFFLWLSPRERWSSITVRVRIGVVELEGAAAGVDAVRMAASIGSAGYASGSPIIYGPPDDLSDWATLGVGDNTADDGIAATTFSINPGGAWGWVPVFVWALSEYRTTAIDADATIESIQAITSSMLIGSMTAPASNPPALLARVRPQRTPDEQAGGTFREDEYQICWSTSSTEGRWIYTQPSIPGDGYAVPTGDPAVDVLATPVDIHALGVVPIQSIAIDAVPATFEPRPGAYYSKRPAAEQWLHMAIAVNNMIDFRRRQWSCWPGPDSQVDDVCSRLWPLRANNAFAYLGGGELRPAGELATDWLTLSSAVVLEEPPEDNGYEAVIALAFSSTPTFSPAVDLRLVAIDGADDTPAEQVVGATATIETETFIKGRAAAVRDADYSPVHHAISGSWWTTDDVDNTWARRGVLGYSNLREGNGRADWARVLCVELPALPKSTDDGDELTYPIRLEIQGKLAATPEADTTGLITAVIGSAIRSADV